MKCLNGQSFAYPLVERDNLRPGMVFTRQYPDNWRFLVTGPREYIILRPKNYGVEIQRGPEAGLWPIDLTMGAPLEDPKRMPV